MIHSSPSLVLVGLESVGKSALFRNLTGEARADETNFRGSTVRVRGAPIALASATNSNLHEAIQHVVDTPGIRVQNNGMTTQLALQQIQAADTIALVVRGTHLQQELDTLLSSLGDHLAKRKVMLAITFKDKAPPFLAQSPRR